MIISFAWTTPAVAISQKTETRRDWAPSTIRMARKVIDEKGGIFDAWTKSPRNRGELFGRVRGIEIIEDEDSRRLPDEAWEREGFHVLQPLGAEFSKGHSAAAVWRYWRGFESRQTVFRFELIELNQVGQLLKAETELRLEAAGGPLALQEALRRAA